MKRVPLILATIIVSLGLFGQNNSQFISQDAPVAANPGEVFPVSVTFKNTGSTTWKTSDNYRLGTQSPQDNTIWGFGNRVALPHDVAPGEEVTFAADLTAPEAGDGYGYVLQWRMVQDGVQWFGDYSGFHFIAVGNSTFADSLLTGRASFPTSGHIVGTSMFHWYGKNAGQLSSPWIPVEGREKWTGDIEFWRRMIKQTMAANIDVYYVLLIPSMEMERINLFKALNQLRREGWDVPKVCPFFDPMITYTIKGVHGNAATEEGKDEIAGHYIRFYKQYYSVNTDEFADDYIYTQDGIPVLDVWHVHLKIDHYDQLTRTDLESRLSAAFGAEHPVFNNGIRMITNAISPTVPFADEKVHQFEVQEYRIYKTWNGITTALLKPGYWDQNVRNPGYFLPRDGGSHYRNSWNLSKTVNRVCIESFNEYDEGSGIYATRTDTIYTKTDGGMNNTESDTWSSTNDPYEYIKATATGAAKFNDNPQLDAEIIWHNIPEAMARKEKFLATVIVRNEGDASWNAAGKFKFAENENLDDVWFGPLRYTLDDSQDDIPTYGGIFRGRVKTFAVEIEAPDTPGTFLTHWGMVQEDVAWFGDTLVAEITVTSAFHASEDESICLGDSLYWHGAYLSQTGTYYDSLLTTGGEDSIYQLNLEAITINPSVTQNHISLTATFPDGEYQWIDCGTFDPIPGETAQTFTATRNGDYAVTITSGGCIDTSSCYSITQVNIQNQIQAEKDFIVYPNPASSNGTIRIEGDFRRDDRVLLISINGTKVYEEMILNDTKRLNLTPQKHNMREGVYILQIISNQNIHTGKILVRN
ncbi:MAG: NBR1-Ig-like domain-containing protein [Bacteroidota bacterium]